MGHGTGSLSLSIFGGTGGQVLRPTSYLHIPHEGQVEKDALACGGGENGRSDLGVRDENWVLVL